jgi:hypothetical protein
VAKECAACYVVETKSVLPTLIPALRIRRYLLADKADIYVFTLDVDDAKIKGISAFVASRS